MNLRKADCGHWIPEDVPPAGETTGYGHSPQSVYLCDECRERARQHAGPRMETKAEIVWPESVVEPDPPTWHEATSTPWANGVAAANDGKSEDDCPYDGRTKDAREWKRGFREAKQPHHEHLSLADKLARPGD